MGSSRAERFAALDDQLEAAVRDSGDGGTTVAVGGSDPIELPAGALKTLHKLVHGLAAGNDPMLTTTEAADFLGVSRPHVTKLIKTGQLAYRKKGNRHLVPTSAVQRFKAERDRKLRLLADMAEGEAELGIR
ncbi:MAG: helix-turn-helix domain-containing protein [Actinomycetes bacterium]